MRFDKSIGIRSIAQAAGVSASTVSRVLRNKGEISPQTRERIERIAGELGYRPNLAVRTMQTGRSGIVGVLLDITDDPLFRGRVLAGIHNALIPADYLPIIVWPRHDDARYHDAAQVHRLVDQRVDGIIMCSDDLSESFYTYIDHLSIPVVLVDRAVEAVHRDAVVTDNALGARLAADHLLGLGHRHICYMSEAGGLTEDGGRGEPFISRVNDHGEARCTVVRISRVHGGYEESLCLLREIDRPTAVFAFNDYIAYHVYRAAQECRLRVPEDLSIFGFGNLPSIVGIFPSLTTFEQTPERVGRIASERILQRISGELSDPPETILLEPTMVHRRSTGPAPEPLASRVR